MHRHSHVPMLLVMVFLMAELAVISGGCGSGKLEVSNASVLEEMQTNFGRDVAGVKVSGSASDVRIDVYTTYHADSDVTKAATGMAKIAAQSTSVLEKHPSVTIDAYVWPKGEEFYMTRASASYTEGKMTAPMDSYTNSVMN